MAGVITTSQSFSNGDNVTSTTLNAIATGSTFGATVDVCANTTLTIVAGKLKVNTITSSEMGTDSVLTANIANLNVTTAKLADTSVTTAKITDLNVTTGKIADLGVTTAKIADANVTTVKIADANVTASKLSGGQTGTAPIYGARAAVDFNADAAVGGNCTIRKSFNVSSVKKTAVGKFEINLANALPSADFVCVANAGNETGGSLASVVKSGSTASLIKITTSTFSAYADYSNTNVIIFA